jgi:tetratricopeptide (TPR) repeat protein
LQQLLKLDTQTFSGKNKSIFIGIVSIVSVLFLMMSSIRCSDWKNNFTLFESGAINAPNSSRTNAALASEYMTLAEKETNMEGKNRLVQNAIASYKKSLNIFPQNSDAAYKVGLIYAMNRDTVNAIKYYKQSLQATAQQIFALNNLGSLYAAQKNYDSAALFFNRSYQADSSNEMTITNLVVVNYLKGNDDQAIYFGNRSLEKNFISSKIYDLLSSCWARKGNNEMAQKYKQLSIDLDNKNKPAYLK